MDENVLERIKARLLSGIKVNDSDFNFMKLNANLFKDIKFIKGRKAGREDVQKNEQGNQKLIYIGSDCHAYKLG